MSHERRSLLKITAAAAFATAFLPFGGAPFLSLDASAKSGNNGNGGGNNGNGGGNGNGNGNGGGNGNSGGRSGNGNGNNGNGKANGGPGGSATPTGTGNGTTVSPREGMQATRSTDGSIQVRHRNGITETIVSNRYVMKDAKGRTISERQATQADVTRLSRYLR